MTFLSSLEITLDPEELNKKILEQREQIDAMTRKKLEDLHEQNERVRLVLSAGHKRILEYFWNHKRKEERADLPLSVVYFFECEHSSPRLRMLNESQVDVLIAELVAKGYIDRSKRKPDQYNFMVRDEDILTLKRLGSKFVNERHPRALVWWTKLLDATPSSVSLFIAALGLVAAVLTVIDFTNHYLWTFKAA